MSEEVRDYEAMKAEVEALARDLMLLVRAATIYPHGHPQMSTMSQRIVNWAGKSGEEGITLAVTSSELVYCGEFFGGKESRAEILARFLNSRKIARLSLSCTLTGREVYSFALKLSDRAVTGQALAETLAAEGINSVTIAALDVGAIHDQMVEAGGGMDPNAQADVKKRREMWLWLQTESGSPRDMSRVLSSEDFWKTAFEGGPQGLKELSDIFAKLGSMLDRALRTIPEAQRGEIGSKLVKMGAALDSENLAKLVDVLLSDPTGTGEALSFLMKELSEEKMAELVAGLVSLGGDKEERLAAFSKSFLKPDKMLAVSQQAGQKKQQSSASGYASEVWDWVQNFLVDFDEDKYMGEGYRETLDRMASRLQIEGERGAAFGMFEDAEMHLDNVMIGISLYNIKGSESRLAERISERMSDMDSVGILNLLESVDQAVPDSLVGRQDVMEIVFKKVVPDIKDYSSGIRNRVIAFAVRHETEVLETALRTLLAEERLTVRKFMVEMLCRFTSNSTPYIVRKARGSIWYFLRNAVLILGRIRDQRAFPFILAQFDHEKAQVRKEAIRAMSYMGARGRAALFQFTEDTLKPAEERQLARNVAERMG